MPSSSLLAGCVAMTSLVISATHAPTRVASGPSETNSWTALTRAAAVDVRPTPAAPSEGIATGSPLLVEQFGPGSGEHVDLINARDWHDAGIDGSGVTVGIIDFFDVDRYWDEAEHGQTPVANTTAACFENGGDCTADFFDGIDEGGEEHGVAVVEAILDVAPGAQILIGQAITVDDYRRLIDWFIERDVDIISRSLGSRYDGPGDGRGPLNEVVDDAVDRGVLWVNSAGNNGRDKYYRHPVRLVGDNVAFGPAGDNPFLRFNGCIALGGIRWANDWDEVPSDRTDYDAYIWESPTGDPADGSIVASSERAQHLGAPPIENVSDNRCPPAGKSLYLEVRWRGGSIVGDVLEILDYGSGIASFTSSGGSAAVSVVDSANPGVLAVGAIDPGNGEEIARYSSRGPANDGRILPDLVAPANYANTVQGQFAGTSAAAAVVTGAGALILGAGLAAGPGSAADLVRHLTIDRGAPGVDNDYGHGQFQLPAPPMIGIDATPSVFVASEIPVRALDTRHDSATGPTALIGRLERGEIVDLPITGSNGVPATNVTAVAVNIVSVAAERRSYLQLLPTTGAMLGGYSNLNIDGAGQTRANFAIIPVGADGSISIYALAEGHLVVDVLGWFEAAATPQTAGRFVELDPPERTLDTRRDASFSPLRSGEVISAAMPAGVDPDTIAALVMTVTATGASERGWIQVLPAGRPDVIAETSTVNVTPGGAVASTAIVPVNGGAVSVTGHFGSIGTSHVIVDVVGYITSVAAPASASGFYVPVMPARAFDSRLTGEQVSEEDSITVDASTAPGVAVPATASGVMWNAAIVGANRSGFAQAWSAGSTRPETSALNWTTPGEVRAAAVITAVDKGRAIFHIEDGMAGPSSPIGDLIVDVFGYFT